MRLLRIRRRFAVLLLTLVSLSRAAEFSVVLRDQKGAPVADAVVSLAPLDAPSPPAPASLPPATIIQEHTEFEPYVTVVRRGTRIDFPNRDQVQHHVYSLSPAKRFEIPLYGGAQVYSEVFDKPGVVTLGCNIHDWMLAYVVVLDTPWFAHVDTSGEASIRGLPVGHYRLEVWHPRLAKSVAEDLIINEGGTQRSLSLTLKPDRRIRRSLEGHGGGGYR